MKNFFDKIIFKLILVLLISFWTGVSTDIVNAFSPPVAGFGNALEFSTNMRIDIPNNESTRLAGSSNFTVSMWIFPEEVANCKTLYRQYGNVSGALGVWLRYECDDSGNGYLYYGFDKLGTGWQWAWPPGDNVPDQITKFPLNQWTHVALTKSGNSVKTYVNGVEDYEMTLDAIRSGAPAPSTGGISIGGDSEGNYFDGRIDEIRFWNTGLDQNKISSWMYREIDDTHPNYENSVINYRLNQSSGTEVEDTRTTTNNGTAVNITDGNWVASDIRGWTVNAGTTLSGKLVGSYDMGSSTDGYDWNLTFEIVDQGSKGTAAVTGDNQFTYTVDINKEGSDFFTYKVRDSEYYSNVQTVNIDIIPPKTISGNAGVAGADLSYNDGSDKTAVADESGAYSFLVPSNWSGTVTPSKTGYTFTPANKVYSNVLVDQSAQDYTAIDLSVISAATVNITAPVTGASPQTALEVETATSNDDYTVTDVAWNETLTVDGKFKAGQVYTATVTLTSKNGKKFQQDSFTPVVASASSVGTTTTAGTDTGNTVSFTATFARTDYTLAYTAGANGSITGTATQTVSHGGNGTEVTAVPDTGYHFVRWSDDVTTAARTDENVTGNISVTATFAATEAPSVTGIAVNTQPTKLTYTEGETLDLAGLDVTLTYSDGSTIDIVYAQFDANGITANPNQGTTMTVGTHNGQAITLTCNECTTTTGNLTINAVSAPTIQSATAGNAHVRIVWNSVDGATGYEIFQSTTSGSYGAARATVSGDVYSYDATGLTNGVAYYFVIKAVNAGGGSPSSAEVTATPYSSSSGGSDESSTHAQPAKTGVDIFVNGKSETAATATTTREGDKTITTIVVDDKKVEKRLEQEGNNAVVTILVDNGADTVVGTLKGQTIKNMENKEAVLEIKTGQVTYTLPASQINIDAVSEQIGKQVEPKDIAVSLKISEPAADTIKIVEDTANKNNYQLMVKPIEFEITCSSGDKKVEVLKFNVYVERMIAVPEGVEPSRITTGVILNSDGTFSHVPTAVVEIDGKYYAKINSLTNSTYSLIYSLKAFKDVENHWAKEAVNDMASRLVLSGVGEDMYEPDRDITRAEISAILVRALGLMHTGTGKDAFIDVPAGTWYYDAVSIASEYGFVSGYGDEKFKPNDKISREQAMVIISMAMEITGLKVDLTKDETRNLLEAFTDAVMSADYAKNDVAACIKAGIILGRNGKSIAPKDNLTRAEAAVIARRLLQISNLI